VKIIHAATQTGMETMDSDAAKLARKLRQWTSKTSMNVLQIRNWRIIAWWQTFYFRSLGGRTSMLC